MATLATHTSNTDQILSNLFELGADAAPNLFEISVTDTTAADLAKKLSLRITNFVAPQRSSTVVKLPYQGTEISLPSPGSTIDNTQTFNMRIDRNYEVYNYLKEKLTVDSKGYSNFSYEKEIPEIDVSLLALDGTEVQVKYKWTFKNCYVVGVAPINMSYDSSGAVQAVVTFIYKECTEESL